MATAAPDIRRREDARHPDIRHIADVLRSKAAHPRTIIIDDAENIAQARTAGVRIEGIYGDEETVAGFVANAPIHALSGMILKDLFRTERASRVFALARAPKTMAFPELLQRSGDIVVLDGVRLVGNIGAITRTACALGAAGLVLLDSGIRTVFDRRLIRASRGLVFRLPVLNASRADFLAFAQKHRLPLTVFSADAEHPVSALRDVQERLALVLGSERQGASTELLTAAQHRYSIPMAPAVESLNVSVAAAIALYEHSFAARAPV